MHRRSLLPLQSKWGSLTEPGHVLSNFQLSPTQLPLFPAFIDIFIMSFWQPRLRDFAHRFSDSFWTA
jgi:hypothetical protein